GFRGTARRRIRSRAATRFPAGAHHRPHTPPSRKRRVPRAHAPARHGEGWRSGRVGQAPSLLERDSSRINQCFANFQSLITVSGEIFNTSAVSSTLKPPKKRSSTTWLFRSYS